MLAGTPIAYWIRLSRHRAGVDRRRSGSAQPGTCGKQPRLRNTSRSDLLFVLFLFAAAAAFAIWFTHVRGPETGFEFSSGYLIELSLSVDNLFVFLVMFRAFGLGLAEQKKGFTVRRSRRDRYARFIYLGGIALLARFSWIQVHLRRLDPYSRRAAGARSAASRPKGGWPGPGSLSGKAAAAHGSCSPR